MASSYRNPLLATPLCAGNSLYFVSSTRCRWPPGRRHSPSTHTSSASSLAVALSNDCPDTDTAGTSSVASSASSSANSCAKATRRAKSAVAVARRFSMSAGLTSSSCPSSPAATMMMGPRMDQPSSLAFSFCLASSGGFSPKRIVIRTSSVIHSQLLPI
jgi:hypothetical protein